VSAGPETGSAGHARIVPAGSTELTGRSLWGLLDALASPVPTPGAGPAAAWTCAVAAALVEMVSAIASGDDTAARAAAGARRERACVLRLRALELAETDMVAYQAVLAARRQPAGADRVRQFREALSAAADPPLAIAEVAAELAALAADAGEQARGGVRGEAATAAILADAGAAACVAMLSLNLAGNSDDPRRVHGDQLAHDAHQHRQRVAQTK
jgi:formiminotetrahydrofolate cyclodeaminase